MNEEAYLKWLSTRPKAIQEAGLRYRPGQELMLHGKKYYVIGFGEVDGEFASLLVSKIDPTLDYEGAIATKQRICIGCVEQKH